MEQQFINIDPQQLQLLLLVAVIATVGAILIAVIATVVLIAMTLRIASEMRTRIGSGINVKQHSEPPRTETYVRPCGDDRRATPSSSWRA